MLRCMCDNLSICNIRYSGVRPEDYYFSPTNIGSAIHQKHFTDIHFYRCKGSIVRIYINFLVSIENYDLLIMMLHAPQDMTPQTVCQ